MAPEVRIVLIGVGIILAITLYAAFLPTAKAITDRLFRRRH